MNLNFKTETIKVDGYESVTYCENSQASLKAIVAVHNTRLGPACGGIRLLPYSSKEDALEDVLRLAKGMSYKSSLAGIGFGGGKSVIIADPAKKNPTLLRAFGEFVDTLNGKYIAAKDMNIGSEDLLLIKEKTRHVLGIDGVPGSSGDPSPVTARGALRAFQATIEELGMKNFSGLKVAIQGIGHVGYSLAEELHRAGAKLWVTDINPDSLKKAEKELNATVVKGDEIFEVDCDIFSPNARGAILNQETIPRLKCKAIVGAANNQLMTPQDGMRLFERGILYAPDFAVNAGGIINIFVELSGYDPKKAFSKADEIYGTIKEIFKRSKAGNKAPFVVADELAEERIYG